MSIGKRIKQRRKELGMTADDLAEKLGKNRATIFRYENGDIENLPLDVLSPLAEVLSTTPAYLMGWEEKSAPQLDLQLFAEARPVHRKRLQMLGNVACGEPIFAEAEQDSMIDADTDADFCLTAKGDSMINARIFDGDLLFVKQCDIVDDGEIAVVLIGDEATVKRFYYDRENNVVTLMPENPLYKPMRYMGADLDTIRVLGRVVAGQYKL